MFSIERHCSLTYVSATILQRQEGILHAFGCRGNPVHGSEGSENSDTAQMAHLFGVREEAFHTGIQVHGDHVALLRDHDGPSSDPAIPCDALLTDRRGWAVGVRTADCVPLLLADTYRRVIGAVHAGWKGTALDIAAKTIAVMADRFASDPAQIIAVIGPSIGPCCYEVGEDVFEAMSSCRWRDDVFSAPTGQGRRMLDLGEANRRQLLKAGIPDGNIVTLPFCTACRRDFFYSWRGEGGGANRQVSGIMLL